MMNSQTQFYEETTQFNYKGILIATSLALVISVPLGYIYTLLIMFIPVVYLGLGINLGLGILIAFLTRIIARLTHNRNKKSILLLAILTSLFVNYFQWVTYVLYAYQGSFPKIAAYLANLGFISQPSAFFSTIIDINTYGLWSMFGTQFTGSLLGTVWIVELAIIFSIPILNILATKNHPYSEKLEKWYPKYTLDENFKSMAGASQFFIELQKAPLEAVKQLGLGSGARHTKIHLYYLEKELNHYLDLESITIDREGKTDRTSLISNFKIDNKTAQSLLNTFDNKRNRIEII